MSIKQALITGTSKGIGQSIASLLLEAGWEVFGICRERGSLNEKKYHHIPFDFCEEKQYASFLKTLCKTISPDALILNSGIGVIGNLEELAPQSIADCLSINLHFHMMLTKACMPFLKKKSGHLLFIGSESALSAKRQGSVYSATKFALRGFAQSLRDELKKSGVRVTQIHPGMTQTQFFDPLSFSCENGLFANDIARAVLFSLEQPPHMCIEEIVVSGQNQMIKKSKK